MLVIALDKNVQYVCVCVCEFVSAIDDDYVFMDLSVFLCMPLLFQFQFLCFCRYVYSIMCKVNKQWTNDQMFEYVHIHPSRLIFGFIFRTFI